MKVSERSVANINVITIYCGTGIIVNETILYSMCEHSSLLKINKRDYGYS